MNRNRFKVLIPDLINPPPDVEREVFAGQAEIVFTQATNAAEIGDGLWQDCDAILTYDKITYDAPLISKLKRCKVISRAGIGYDNIDLKAAREHNILVCNVPDYCIEEVADHTMGLLFSLVRGLPEHDRSVREHRWERESPMSFRLQDKVLGLIGFGRIGSAMAVRAKAFGLRVIYFDPYIQSNIGMSLGVRRVHLLEKLAERSDIISIHTPLTSETNGMINDHFFSHTKKGAVLLNTARGPIIDFSALERAMQSGTVKACGLDVLPVEPLDESEPLMRDYAAGADWLKGRLIVTPHVAFYSHEAARELKRKSALEAWRVLNGEPPMNCVNNVLIEQ